MALGRHGLGMLNMARYCCTNRALVSQTHAQKPSINTALDERPSPFG
jgi:hypothetical protein